VGCKKEAEVKVKKKKKKRLRKWQKETLYQPCLNISAL
jgi:hypothetical protein